MFSALGAFQAQRVYVLKYRYPVEACKTPYCEYKYKSKCKNHIFWNINSLNTHRDWRFVKFPIDGERVPDKRWLGAPLHKKKGVLNYFRCSFLLELSLIMGSFDVFASLFSLVLFSSVISTTYRLVTKLSVEQVTMAQLHGSTACSSQLRTL